MAELATLAINPLFFEGAVSLEEGHGWIRAWRIPFEDRGLFPPEDGLPWQAQKGSGVRLRFRTNSARIGLDFLPVLPDESSRGEVDPRRYDLTIEGDLIGSKAVEHTDEQVVFENVPGGDRVVELWLAVHSPTRIRGLLLEPGAAARAVPDDRPRWTTYGSSITNCRGAHSPARTWPAIVARRHGLNLTCLGFGGQCHLDPMVARLIRDLPADFISLKVGINVMGAASLSPRTFRPAIIGMVEIIREKHPDTPMVIVSALGAPPWEATPNEVGFTLQGMRAEAEDAYRRLVNAGDRRLFYVNGLDLFNEEDAQTYSEDLVHPNADGYDLVGENFSQVVMSRIEL